MSQREVTRRGDMGCNRGEEDRSKLNGDAEMGIEVTDTHRQNRKEWKCFYGKSDVHLPRFV